MSMACEVWCMWGVSKLCVWLSVERDRKILRMVMENRTDISCIAQKFLSRKLHVCGLCVCMYVREREKYFIKLAPSALNCVGGHC